VALGWAVGRAAAKGWTGVTVSCEPAGHRWRVLGQLAADRPVPFVCVRPVVTSWSRRTEDLTPGKTDEKDAVLIARLTAQLRCYVPELVDETWGRLRHLGIRREQLIAGAGSQIQQMRDLLECVWPAALDTARQPFRSPAWMAALQVITSCGPGGFTRTRRLGAARFEQAVRREITRRGGQKPCLRIVRGLFTALSDPAGVIAHRAGALGRVQLLLEDWQLTKTRLTQAGQPMTAVLGELGLTTLVTSITGLPPVGAAAILAETGGPRRFATARALVKHAGPAPREKLSGAFTGRARLTGQGRPGLRLAAWRAVWGAQRANPVYRARYQQLTSTEQNKLTPTQAQTVIAAAIPRHLHAVITTGHAWDPAIATHTTQHTRSTRHLSISLRRPKLTAGGEPSAALRHSGDPGAHHGQPRPSSHQPGHALPGQPHNRYAGTDDGPGTGRKIDTKQLTLMSGRSRGCIRFVWAMTSRARSLVARVSRRLRGWPAGLWSAARCGPGRPRWGR
jgi:transposase